MSNEVRGGEGTVPGYDRSVGFVLYLWGFRCYGGAVLCLVKVGMSVSG